MGLRKDEIMIRFKDMFKDMPYKIIIKDLGDYEIYNRAFIKFEAYISTKSGLRPITLIFPKWKFRTAYMKHTEEKRREVGKYNVEIEFYKRDKGKIDITSINKYHL